MEKNGVKDVETDRHIDIGATGEVRVAEGDPAVRDKDLPDDQSLDLAADSREVWLLGGRPGHLLPQSAGASSQLDPGTAKAQWIDARTVVVPPGFSVQVFDTATGGTPKTLPLKRDDETRPCRPIPG
ncbi:hypothetical protein [Kitasatospora sp. NPDC008115]|uniref:hypothetical protein n=1 Tax=Kitasatospora sp. NPDC008115 TaxID=3364022 RepID=UPI0036E50736